MTAWTIPALPAAAKKSSKNRVRTAIRSHVRRFSIGYASKFNVPSAILNWEEVSGKNDYGSLVYIAEIKGATTAENPAVVPYYRDDSCFDDGTGTNPGPHTGGRGPDACIDAVMEALTKDKIIPFLRTQPVP